jgi:hypothetical protein
MSLFIKIFYEEVFTKYQYHQWKYAKDFENDLIDRSLSAENTK